MERSSHHSDLATALAEARPAPRASFAGELDERLAAGFPRRSRPDEPRLGGLIDFIRGLSPQRLLFATGAGALAAIGVATVIVASQGPSSQPPVPGSRAVRPDWRGVQLEAQPAQVNSGGAAIHAPSGAAGAASGESESSEAQSGSALGSAPAAETSARAHRDIERSAEIGLLADPADVADDSAAVFAAVHDARGIVLHSTTRSGKRAGARFELLIPSANLGDALAALSAIDAIRTRHEGTEDITAPTVDTSERLRDSRARIDGLLAQLSAAETETEASAIEAELARERRHAAGLRAQLEQLEQRTDFSRVSVRIETDGSPAESGGSWGIDDALGDAGHILGIAAGVTLIGLAVLGPLALIALLAWLAHRAWVRAQRKRALRDA